jgi:NAD-dependent deacetylase sirtuin 2
VFFGESLPNTFTDNKFQDFEQCDLLIVIGTSLVVYPFAGLVNEVKPIVPRVLINKESVGAFRRVTGEEAPSMLGNYRDVAYIGSCDEGVSELAELLGWKDELENMK